MGSKLIWLQHAAITEEVVVSFLQERVALVTCLNCIVVTSAWRQFNFSESAFDIETEADSVKPFRLDCFVTLFIFVRSWLHAR